MSEYYFHYNLKLIGKITVRASESFIKEVSYGHEDFQHLEKKESELILQCKTQLEEYLSGKRRTFDIPISPDGTEFQIKVWEVLDTIPYGATRSYKWVAEKVGSPKACRAVGMANNRNPISIILPCHRVIGADGKLVGYGGGLNIKETLLALENSN